MSSSFQAVYGVGQLLVERQVTSAPPQMLLGSPLVSGGSYHLTVSDGSAAPSYELDIRTASGFQNRLTGLQRDAAQQLHVPESALSPGETNVLRLRAEGEPGTGYSVPVSLLYDPSVTPSSPNQIRSLGVSRNGTDLVLRWALLTENGKQTKVSFRRADTGATYVLTPQALASSIKSYTLSSQALASPCGDFLLSQVLQANETGPTPPLRNPSSQSGTQGTEIDPCDDPPPDPAPGLRFTNAYHHRDHLGTLCNVTGDGGYLAAAYDWYPYGTRMRTGLADSASDSRRVFTGHERDLATGLDYMMARYYGPSLARFLSTDPGDDTYLDAPQSWNKYLYVRDRPVDAIDPTGEETQSVAGANRHEAKIGVRIAITQGPDRALAVKEASFSARAAGAAAASPAAGTDRFGDNNKFNSLQHAVGACVLALNPNVGLVLARELLTAHETGDTEHTDQEKEFDLVNDEAGLALTGVADSADECTEWAIAALEGGLLQTELSPPEAATPLLDKAQSTPPPQSPADGRPIPWGP